MLLPGRVGDAEQALEVGVEQRQRPQEGVVVVGQPVGDLVDDAQTRAAHQAGLPQGEHVAPQRAAVGGQLLRRELDPVALVEQAGDLHLAVDRALAADLGRMGRQHRAAQGVVEEARAAARATSRAWRARPERIGHGARPRRRLGLGVGARAADVVLVLGDVGEVREIAEGADDAAAPGRSAGRS